MNSNRLKKGELPPLTGNLTICKLCQEEKDDALFKWSKGKRVGLVCRACDSIKKKNLYLTSESVRAAAIERARKQTPNPEVSKAYRENNKEALREKKKEYHENNKEKINEKTRKWYKNNKERHAENGKLYREKNEEKIRLLCRQWYLNNKELCQRNSKEWRKNNKQKLVEYFRNYYIEKQKRTPLWSEEAEIKEFYKNAPEGYEVDHIIPLFGKNVSGLHVISNLQYLTRTENSQKSNRYDPMVEHHD